MLKKQCCLFLSLSLRPEMKRLAYITAVILSLLIIYSGAGVSIVHYCCARCAAVQNCCVSGCSKCQKAYISHSKKEAQKSHSCDSKKDCREKGCTATIYKLDLMKNVTESTVSVPATTLFCEQFCYLFTSFYVDKPAVYHSLSSSPPSCSRQKLALFSVFII